MSCSSKCLGILVAAVILVIAMAGKTIAMSPLYLECTVISRDGMLEADFSASFCSVLAKYLRQDLDVALARNPPRGSPGVAVKVKLLTDRSAEATISTGEVGANGLVVEKSTSSRVTAHDRGLSIGAARTLVRPIAVQLGLAR
jgi:hypothetical protein